MLDAWKILYDEQIAKNPFPVEELGQDCKDVFDAALNTPKVEIPRPYREEYQNYIKNYFPKLQKMIDIRRIKEDPSEKDHGGKSGAAAPGAFTTGNNVEPQGLVHWELADRKNFEDRFVWQDTPSTLAILLAQEDLWVCQALLRVISNCNEGAAKTNPPPRLSIASNTSTSAATRPSPGWRPSAVLTPGGPVRLGMPPTGPGGMSGPGGATGPGGMMGPGMGGREWGDREWGDRE